jgi:hypothetical protein
VNYDNWKLATPTEYESPTKEPVDSCKTCGTTTDMGGPGQCEACWEVESRLTGYLRRGGERARVRLRAAIERAG